MKTNQIFQYNGSPITFYKDDNVMVNATEMAKPFGKLVGDWLRLKATTEFTEALSADMHIPISALIQVVKGGNSEQGTWLHEDVALEFARWLSPSFAIWCNKRIKELLQYGMTAMQPTLEQMINNPDLVISLATQLKNEREEKQRLEQQNALQEEQLLQAAPKVSYYDNHLQSVNTQTSTQVAKQIGMDGKHTIFRHDNFIGCFSADKIKMSARKYFCFNIPIYKNMVEDPSCRSPYHEEYIQTSVSGNPEGLCRSTYSFLSERR